MKLLFETPVARPWQTIRDGFTRELFIHLSPGFIPFNLKKFEGCKKGDEIQIEMGLGPIKENWISLITFAEENESGWSFIDEGKVLPFPLSYWKHHHRVDKIDETHSLIVDDIQYECRPGFLTPLLKPFLWSVFAIRPERYQSFFKD